MSQEGYLSIKGAARKYGVSRAKLHRLIQQGRLATAQDPKDERVTLVSERELEQLLTFTGVYTQRRRDSVSVRDVGAIAMREGYSVMTERLTTAQRLRVDALRERLMARGEAFEDSVDVVHRERGKRTERLSDN